MLEEEQSLQVPNHYFSTVLPKVRARIDASAPKRTPRRLIELVLPAAALALLVMVFLTVRVPWEGPIGESEALAEAIGSIPADVLADAVMSQADQAGVLGGSDEVYALGAISDKHFADTNFQFLSHLRQRVVAIGKTGG